MLFMEFGVQYWVTVFNALWTFMDTVFNSFGAYAYVLGGFFVFVVVRFLIGPIFGIAIEVGSDKAIELDKQIPRREQLYITDKGDING